MTGPSVTIPAAPRETPARREAEPGWRKGGLKPNSQ